MPFGSKPSCSSCNGTKANIWRKGTTDKVFCGNCAKRELDGIEDIIPTGAPTLPASTGTIIKSEWAIPSMSTRGSKDGAGSHYVGPLRKSARTKPSKYKHQPLLKTLSTKGKSRRVIFKKNPIKSPAAVSTVVTSEYIFYEGQYWQVGDIASVMGDDGGIYYVQLRGFLQDQYCEKSAVITWLLPTTASPPGKFDPATFIIGPEEDLPRSMSCFDFVMHAPSSYFCDKSAPYRTKTSGPELGFIWTHLGPEIRRVPPQDQIYGLQELDSDIPATPPERVKVKAKQDGERKRKTKERKNARNNKDKVAAKVMAKEKAGPKKEEKTAVKESKVNNKSEKESKNNSKEKVSTLAEGRGRRDRGKPKVKDT